MQRAAPALYKRSGRARFAGYWCQTGREFNEGLFMRLINDWSWKPDSLTSSAMKRGEQKLRDIKKAREQSMFDFNASARKRISAKAAKEHEKSRQQIRVYLERIKSPAAGATAGPRLNGPGSGVLHANELAGAADKTSSSNVRSGRRRNHGVASGSKQLGATARRNRRGVETARVSRRSTRANIVGSNRTGDAGADFMSWATIVMLKMSSTQARARFGDSSAAIRAGEAFPDNERDYVVVSPGTLMSQFSNVELDALMTQFGDARLGLSKPVKESAVKGYLSQFDASRHGPDGIAKTPYTQVQIAEAKVSTTQTAAKAKKKTPAAVVAKGAKGKGKTPLKAKTPKRREKLEQKGDGLGREGTPARFIREQYLAGKETANILEAVKKKFPKNTIKNSGYVSWYYNDMVKRGQIKKH